VRHVDDNTGMEGQDSFLDVVANIVGILILLVMVMGVRALREPQLPPAEQTASASEENQADKKELEDEVRAAVASQAEVRDLVLRTVSVHREALMRDQERVELSTFVAAASQEIDKHRAELDEQQKSEFDLRRKLVDAQLKFDDLSREQIALMSQEPDVLEVENVPTPLAQIVTGKEVHLRVADGHVSIVPADELIELFKEHAQNNLWRLKDQNEFVGTVGPVGGFRLRFRLQKGYFTVRQGSGMEQRGAMIQLAKADFLPVTTPLGEPVEQALLPNSDLNQYLKKHPPDMTTVTIWAYPNSFNEFRSLRRELFEKGYATAGRPLPEGVLIGFSPQGTHSAAQ
jgi:hypothetical protein